MLPVEWVQFMATVMATIMAMDQLNSAQGEVDRHVLKIVQNISFIMKKISANVNLC